ncbi:hypothetical protein ACEPAH_8998 [Sanghuangporus vaninii]
MVYHHIILSSLGQPCHDVTVTLLLLLLTSTHWFCWSTMAQDVRLMQYSNNVTSMVNDGGTTATASTARSSGSAEVPPDSVSSLRALALSTLRSKRRKDTTNAAAVPSHSLPARPLPPDIGNVFLDYGTEAKEEQDSLVSSTLSVDRKPANSSISEAAFDAEVKEEGEISDEEFCASSIASSTSPKHSAKDANHGLKSLPSTKATHLVTTPIKIEPQKSPPSPNEQHLRQSSVAPQDRGIWNSWVPSEDHVRPGLKMNMEQFNLAKELILDLLGWGVSPEYLVDCGLTREAVFYTFMELNLKLPRNLDVSGFLPSSSPPAPTSKNDGQISPLDAQRASLSHPLPAKPATQAPSMTSLTTTASISQQAHPNGQNLSDMEARRRLELQARKAVLASRRKKAMPSSAEPSVPATSSATPTVLDGSIVDEPESIVPTTAIDDFLKSMIETTSTSSQSSTPVSAHKARTLSGGVPLGVSTSTSSTVPTRSPVTSTFPASTPTDMDTKQDAMDGLLQADPAPSRPESFIDGMISMAPASTRKTTVISGGSTPVLTAPQVSGRPSRNAMPPTAPREMRSRDSFTSSPSNVQVTNGRRGTKRPVAMDFVDVEHDSASQHGASMSAQPPSVRRKLGSFAGLGSHASRRCVIDLSDSEGDDEHDEIVTEKQLSQIQQAPSSTLNASRVAVTPTPAPRLPSARPASTAGLRPPQSASPALSPEALEDKERQIKQMREMIARREQERLRKLAEKSRTPAATPPHYSSTPGSVGVEPLPPSTVSISMKAEDVNRSSSNTSTSKLVYQPSRSESSASDQADEDVVMQTLDPSGPSVPFPPMGDKSAHTREVNAETSDDESGKPMDVTHQDTPSAQVEFRQDDSQSFTQYISPFSYYPLLRSRTRVVSDLGSDTFHTSTTSARPSVSPSCISSVVDRKITVPDLRPLRVAVASREVGDGEGRRICQFEVPGGGVCADKTCTDLHINDLEPDDHEIARYLREVMPDVLQAYDETEIVDQLLQARQKNSNATKSPSQVGSSTSLANRVSEAITALLGSRR